MLLLYKLTTSKYKRLTLELSLEKENYCLHLEIITYRSNRLIIWLFCGNKITSFTTEVILVN